jgi:transcription elongation factor GreA
MTEKEVFLTYEGLKKIEKELEELKTVKRKDIAERIKTALEFGDISENSEYDEAKNDQAQLELRIATLENILKHAKVIDEDDINTNIVCVGVKVRVKDLDTKEEIDYTIVGSTEVDPFHDKISNESPVGSALMGKKKGDKVKINVPEGIVNLKIIEIHK